MTSYFFLCNRKFFSTANGSIALSFSLSSSIGLICLKYYQKGSKTASHLSIRKKSISGTISTEEEEKDERYVVPALPMPVAILCCVLNFIIPGVGEYNVRGKLGANSFLIVDPILQGLTRQEKQTVSHKNCISL